MSLPKTYVEGFHDVEMVRKMKYRTLGKTDMAVSLLGFGGAGLSGFYEDFAEEDAIHAVRESIRKGINYIDTAPFYGEGRSEKLIGKALKGIPREAFYISTKVGRYSKKMEEQFNYSAEKIKSRFKTSLDLLGLDYVDIVILHDVEFAKMKDILEESLPALQEIVRSGRARYIGISGYPLSRLLQVVNSPQVRLDLVLSYCRDTLIDSSLRGVYSIFKNKGLGVINASPIAQGLLTNAGPPEWQCADTKTKELCARAASYCKERGVELGRLAIYYTLESPVSETVLVGMNSFKILEMNLDLVYNGLTQKEKEILDYIKKNILKAEENLHWEGVELKQFNMEMD